MSIEEIRVPDLGGSDEVEVIEINVKAGDEVAEEDPIITVESDKASVELPSPLAGRIQEVKVSEGDSLKEGDLVATIETESGSEDGDGSEDEDQEKDEDDEQVSAAADEEPADDEEEEESEAQSSGPAPRQDDDRQQEKKESAPERSSSASGKQGGGQEKTVTVPDIGDSDQAPVVEINVEEGDEIEKDDALVTLESDKAAFEVPSPYRR